MTATAIQAIPARSNGDRFPGVEQTERVEFSPENEEVARQLRALPWADRASIREALDPGPAVVDDFNRTATFSRVRQVVNIAVRLSRMTPALREAVIESALPVGSSGVLSLPSVLRDRLTEALEACFELPLLSRLIDIMRRLADGRIAVILCDPNYTSPLFKCEEQARMEVSSLAEGFHPDFVQRLTERLEQLNECGEDVVNGAETD